MYLKINLSISKTRNDLADSAVFQSERKCPSILHCKQVHHFGEQWGKGTG